jgi:hypothetical protein
MTHFFQLLIGSSRHFSHYTNPATDSDHKILLNNFETEETCLIGLII